MDIGAPAEIFIVVSYTKEEGKEDTKARELDGSYPLCPLANFILFIDFAPLVSQTFLERL